MVPAKEMIDPTKIDWEAVDEAMRAAVQRAVWEHKQLGYPIFAMKNGQMQWIPDAYAAWLNSRTCRFPMTASVRRSPI